MFQFQNGAIKRAQLTGEQEQDYMFQFQNGAIKSLPL